MMDPVVDDTPATERAPALSEYFLQSMSTIGAHLRAGIRMVQRPLRSFDIECALLNGIHVRWIMRFWTRLLVLFFFLVSTSGGVVVLAQTTAAAMTRDEEQDLRKTVQELALRVSALEEELHGNEPARRWSRLR